MNLKKISLIILLLFLCLTITHTEYCLAITETTKNQETVTYKEAKTIVTILNYVNILQKAQTHSYNIKIADYDTLITKQSITRARAEYLPKLYAQAGTEYNKNFNNDNFITSYVGDAYINPYTRFQSLFGFTLAYNVFDFGVRRGKLDMAKEDVSLKKKIVKQQTQELNLNIIDTYSKILMYKTQIDKNNEILSIQKNNYNMKKRLYKVHEISKTELNSQNVEIRKTENKILELKSHLAESLNLLSFYTGEEYDIEKLKISEIPTPQINPYEFEDYTQTLVWDIQESIIQKKLHELKVVKRTNLPKVNLYSKYYLYNQDQTNYAKSLGLNPSNFTIGGTLSMPVFDGLQNLSDIRKSKLELEKLHVERDKAIAEYRQKLQTMRSNLTYLDKEISGNEKIVKELKDKTNSQNILLSQKLISPIELNETKIELLNEQMEYQKNMIAKTAILNGIQVITTYKKE